MNGETNQIIKITILLSLLIGGLALPGCYSLPRQTGEWRGKLESKRLVELGGVSFEAVEFTITDGAQLKKLIPAKMIVVDNKDRAFGTNHYLINGDLKIRGEICTAFVMNPSTGKRLWNGVTNENLGAGFYWVIRTSPKRISD